MLEHILVDDTQSIAAENQPVFSLDFDFDGEQRKHAAAVEKWKHLPDDQRATYSNKIDSFIKANGVRDLRDPTLIPAKNWSIVQREIEARVRDQNVLELLPVSELHFEQALLEIVENIENVEHVRDLYKLRKRTTGSTRNAGISAGEATRIKNCLRQGRELYLSGKSGSLMVKPLNFFYSLTAYAYGIIILNSPIRYSLDNLPGSHGLNYLPTDAKAQFGGDMPRGTFSDLFTSFPTFTIKNKNLEIIQDNSDSLFHFYKNRFTTSTGTLLSMVPEIREYYKLVTGQQSRTYPLEVSLGRAHRSVVWEFQIGDGEVRPSLSEVQKVFDGFAISERFGKVVVDIPASSAHKMKASIYTDAKGGFWYIENPFFPLILPEECVHFILTNAFSNIMRYSPDNWGSILFNEGNSEVSLITRKYLSAFENKFPLLALRSISRFYPYVSTEN
ncbi:TPA: hypothetical protein QDA71_006083 [Burkholderia vietnamiensis]|uniref:YaaC family protein n=1 Tax=Burkholderia vietnamiensis TaxID=60552 RepID=UPI0009C151B8|nr:YaaC family protein [Burkholderia vietnamiensis]MBR8163420.1 hypothetical protein [Burkholderia vietnamiensis]MCA8146776.1 YaaC family protein [Burkholderia vietnamiensis]HDR8949000.1 hypothetical protein [Burkholderia vietnamiensis]HDR9208637.1 hypothetical protein [Burkholderia vietnamiensis]HDR9236730.1 hypothetical protein [Burkholderia vietnamiensis]